MTKYAIEFADELDGDDDNLALIITIKNEKFNNASLEEIEELLHGAHVGLLVILQVKAKEDATADIA